MASEFRLPIRYRRSSIIHAVVILLFTLIFSAITPQTAQAVLFGVGCGASRIASLISVINQANSNGSDDTINLAAGCTYTLPGPDNQTDGANGLPVIVSGHGTLTINGNGATIRRDPNAALTFRIFEAHGNLTLNDLTLADGNVFNGNGGAILSDGTLTLNNTTVRDNQADWGGHLPNNGGGIAIINGGTLTLSNSTVSGNTMSNGDGGGIAVEDATLTVNNSTIRGNHTDDAGGGIKIESGVVTIRNSVIENNTAGSFGAGIDYSALAQADNLRVVSSTINHNTASNHGGGISTFGDATILDSTISNNAAPDGAGAYVEFAGFRLVVTNDTFYGNTASDKGGGIYNQDLLTVTNSTFNQNTANGSGGALYNEDNFNGGARATLNNSIFANSTGGDCVRESGTTITASHTLMEDTAHHCGIVDGSDGNIIGQAPHLGGLTGSPKYYPLNASSPAINTGDDSLIDEATVNVDLNGDGDKNDTISIDEPGNPRVRGGIVDMGAFESSVIPTPLPSATKSVSGTFEVGQTVTYTVTITNNGVGSQPNNFGHEFNDTLPVQLTLVSASATDGNAATSGNTVTWDGSIASDATVTITITATINAGTTGQTVSNQGIVNYDSDADGTNDSSILTDDPGQPGASDPTAFVVVGPQPTVDKDATDLNGGNLVPGDRLRYTITIGNSGTAAAVNVTLTDNIPANTTYIADSTTLNGNPVGDAGGTMPYASGASIGDLASGANAVVIFDVTVNNPLPAGVTEIDNQASVSADNADAVATVVVPSPVTTTPGLSLNKSDGNVSVSPGGTVTYTLGYQNTGNIGLTNVILSETVPANTTFDATDSSAGWSCADGSPAGTPCALSLGTLAGGENGSKTFAVTVDNPLPPGTTQISNSASIASGGTNASANDTTPLTGSPPIIGATKTATDVNSGSLVPGDTLLYTITVSNSGATDATNVVLTDAIPANTTYVANSTTLNGGTVGDVGGAMPFAGGGSLGTITANGGTAIVTFKVTVDNPLPAGVTEIDNQASVTGDGFSPTSTGVVASPVTTTSTLSLAKDDGGASVAPGGIATYTLSYQNTGNIALDNAALSETVPANTTFNATDSSASWNCADGSPAGTPCSLSLGTLAGGESGSKAFAVTVDNPLPPGTIQINNSASIASGGTNASASDTTPLTGSPPIMGASKTATDVDGGSLVPGDTLLYTVTVSNSGATDATGVTLTDTIPANTSYVPGTTKLNAATVPDNGTYMPFAAGGSIGTISAGNSATVIFEVTINDPLLAGVTSVSNQGTVSGNNFATITTNLLVSPVVNGLTISKAFGVTHLSVGATTTLRFTVTNPAGNPALTGLSFNDLLPNGLVFSGTPAAAQCGGTVSLSNAFTLGFSGGTLGAGLSTCTIEAAVSADGTVTGQLNNLSSVVTADGGLSSAAGANASIQVDLVTTAIPTPGATVVPASFFQCENLAVQSGGAMTSTGGIGAVHFGNVYGNVYCHIIAKDGSYVTSSAEIGIESVIQLGVTQAVDVFGELPDGTTVVPFDLPIQICLRGAGEALFLNAADAGRTVQRLAAVNQNGYLCVSVLGSGTVVLVSATSGIQAPPPAPAAPQPSVQLANCRVTTTNAPLNLRAEPDTSAAVLAQLPYNLTLTATERVPGWYRIIYLNGQGWVSQTYLSFAGDCGS